MKFARPRGTQDIFGERMIRWKWIEEKLTTLAASYGYSEIRTPVFEMSDLFVRTVGEATDIVTKEMYTFKDRKGRNLTLRPENTAPVMRAFIENGLQRSGGVTRFFYIGPMFRYDRPQAGRYRQFHQFGAEAIGTSNPAVDAEIIDMSLRIYGTFGFQGLEVRLNSVGCPKCRPAFRQILVSSLEDLKEGLCGDCAQRYMINPMRIFDCKECGEIKAKLPIMTDHLCGECSDHFAELQRILREMGISYVHDPLLVRGLDYYTKTAFEILHPGLGGQNALCGGGRYDGLAEDCGAGSIPAIGFSAGMERLMENLPEEALGGIDGSIADVFFIVPQREGYSRAMSLASGLRDRGMRVEVDLSGRSIKKQLKTASESGARRAVFIGIEELEGDVAAVKDLDTGEQRRIPFAELASYVGKESSMEKERE